MQLELEILKEEYEKEKQTTHSLDSKAGIFLSALIVIVTVWMQIIPIKNIIDAFYSDNYFQIVVMSILILILFSLFSIDIFFLVKCLTTKDYSAVNIESIISEGKKAIHYIDYINAIVDHYKEIICNNSVLNQKKSNYLKYSVNFFGIYSVLNILILILISDC